MGTIVNPVLPGFHPDPSMLRVGEWFYVANSTFEWYGGVEISRSRDLVNWEFACRPLCDRTMLDMEGNPASGGIWAPCLSFADGKFWLIFTDVKNWADPFKDSRNFVTVADDVAGPWSAPVFLNGSGFDPSLFHDGDGRKWFVNMEWDYRATAGPGRFAGILLQEFDPATMELMGMAERIFAGTPIGMTEGPHLYRKDGWYYLLTAEGGTEYGHAVTVARSRSVRGPYETHPANPLMTSRGDHSLELQKAGHGSLCEGPDGTWWIAFLSGRPLPGSTRCVLGRETSIACIEWREGWPWVAGGGNAPGTTVAVPWKAEKRAQSRVDYGFADEGFLQDFMTLRLPFEDSRFSLAERPGFLTLIGKDSPASRHEQTLIARRQTDFRFRAETRVTFEPGSFHQMAGLAYRYDERNQYYLRITRDGRDGGRTLGILAFDAGRFSMPLGRREIGLPDGEVRLGLEVRESLARFFWSMDGSSWAQAGPDLDASILSDEYDSLGFTGAFVGMACHDLESRRARAWFSRFSYEAL